MAAAAADAVGQGRRRTRGDEDLRTDVALDFALDEHGCIRMIREGDPPSSGGGMPVCAEMRRFLAEVAQLS